MSFNISPISPEKVLELSNGEVRIDETLNFKSKLPVREGLFCQKIFGPVKDYTCECGKYEGKKYTGYTCENCGVTVISSRSRSERMGHINLQLPIVNPICQKALLSIFDVKTTALTAFLRGKYSVILDTETNSPNLILKDGKQGKITFVKKDDVRLSNIPAGQYTSGSIALYNIAKELDVAKTLEVNDSKYLKLYDKNNFKITNLFLLNLPVSPPNYRALIPMDNYYSTDAKNDLYLRVVRRSIRLKRVLQLGAMDEIVCEENNLIYKAVNELFLGGAIDGKGNELKGILEGLSGKRGIIRKNILGKRVDYSGRSAITSSGGTLEMDEIGLPRKMAYELFKPFIISEILENYAETYKEADAIYKQKSSIAIKSMEKIIKGRRILMNRAPTLHRYGIMSFKIKLVDGETLFVHPMICVPFNADFDGDQVGIHVPLSDDALRECEELMAPQHNILASLDGTSQLNPTHEMVIGLDIMTRIKEETRYPNTIFNNITALEYLYNTTNTDNKRQLDINEQILWKDDEVRKTCLGRLLIENLLKTKNLPERFTKSTIRNLIGNCYDNFEPEQLLKVLHKLMNLSLNYVTLSGFSICSQDCVIPSSKKEKVRIATDESLRTQEKYETGEISFETKFEDNIRLWDTLVKDLQEDWKREVPDDNSVKMMLTTGARVGMTQVSQLNIAKGLITDTSNRIIETPILNSLTEGLTTYEYFRSCSGSRKSMADKAKLTPDSGYLTRRMVTVARDFFIVKEDCGTDEGVLKQKNKSVGRFTCDGEFIEKNSSEELVKVRSPIFCKASEGICVKCYGLNPSNRKLITVGSNVGTVAAQSLTESTTQMTMKTFHTSGAAVVHDSPLIVKSHFDGHVRIRPEGNFLNIDVISNDETYTYIVDQTKSRTYVVNDQFVQAGDKLSVYTQESLENDDVSGSLPKIMALYEASIPAHAKECLLAPADGTIKLEISYKKNAVIVHIDDRVVGVSSNVPIFVCSGQKVKLGQVLTYGSPNIGKFFKETDNLSVCYDIFENSVLDICKKEGLDPNLIHLEVIFRCMSNLVLMEDDLYGLLSHGDVGKRQVLGINQIGRIMPSWLKSMGYGYTTETIESSAIELRNTYDLSSEKLMYGELIFDHKKVS